MTAFPDTFFTSSKDLAMPARSIAPAISAALKQIADSPSLSLTAADVPAAAEVVTRHILPALEHLSNGESWYRSRVTWGAVISAIAPVLPLLGMGADWFDPTVGAALLAVVAHRRLRKAA